MLSTTIALVVMGGQGKVSVLIAAIIYGVWCFSRLEYWQNRVLRDLEQRVRKLEDDE